MNGAIKVNLYDVVEVVPKTEPLDTERLSVALPPLL